ncbi:hypothetical protein K2173_001975 [Erythroxylum novogranatense]|uniref:RING-type E3 ubiquitin transferase n=1 Tax=Erythroxylum novogranatense TaxID=1862640 RepID=A0AAV8SP68_9ROSI|nr:hypothetical protein K2173_001975 [Erythroxylum novogranatense]
MVVVLIPEHNLYWPKSDMVMEHRRFLNPPQNFENEQDQHWNHAHMEQLYTNMARTVPVENASFCYPVENTSVNGVHFTPPWSSAPTMNGYFSSSHGVEVSYHQPDLSVPPQDPFLHSSSAGNFCTFPENYSHLASSSNYHRQTFHHVEDGFVDLTMGNGRGPHKRKSPGIPSSSERSSTIRYNDAGSSSELPLSLELRQEKSNLDPQRMPMEQLNMNSSYRGNLSLHAEGSTRNVRSKPALDVEYSLATNLPGIHSNDSFSTTHPVDRPTSLDFQGQCSSASTHEWNHARMSPPRGRIVNSDVGDFGRDTNYFPVGNSMCNPPLEVRGYQRDFYSRRNSASLSSHVASRHSERSIRSGHSLRSSPSFRVSSGSIRLGHIVPSDDNLELVPENYYFRQQRQLFTPAWQSGDRNGRSRVSNERYRSLPTEAALHDRFSSEGLMTVEHPHFYRSRNMFDQHRDMRLDIDNMSYEELLALGERIGHVNTGLSEESMSKCLIVTLQNCSDHKEGICAICLEEYQNMDDIGGLRSCGHEYHVSCIKKWLSMKNSCPICKTSALEDNLKDG